MLRIRFLRNILLLALVTAGVLPLCASLFIPPSYEKVLIAEAEGEAVRFAKYLTRSFDLDGRLFDAETLPGEASKQIGWLTDDSGLIKIRIFSPTGKIIYSTDSGELGLVNDKAYFRNQVMAGQVYSKIVRHDGTTAERQTVQMDLVETYVPLMAADAFGGAIEIYYDISVSLEQLESVGRRSALVMWGVSLALLIAIVTALYGAQRAVARQQKAERELQQANNTLEDRIAERSGQLQEINAWLTREIASHRQARSEIDGILRSVADGLLVIDAEGSISLMNRAAEELMAARSLDVVGRRPSVIGRQAPLLARLWMVLDQAPDGKPFDVDLSDSADQRYIRVRKSLLSGRVAGGEGQVVLLQDVTEEHRRKCLQSEFLAMVAHELHTPLTAVVGYAELLSGKVEGTFSEEQKQRFAHHVYSTGLALSRIVDDLQDVGRLEMGQSLSMHKDDFPLAALIWEQAQHYDGSAGKHVVRFTPPEEPIVVTADQNRIGQVLENLLSNAVKYSPDGGRIEISLQTQEEVCRVAIADEGIGMSEEEANRVFEKFYRCDPDNASVKGTGLGMFIAKHIIESHGGEIGLHSRLGHGTVVHFTLPLADVAAASAAVGES